MKIVITIICLMFSTVSLASEVWTPKPNFRVDKSNYMETLTFIAGIAYALTESNNEMTKIGKSNFMCNAPEIIDSKLLIDIVNKKHKGNITSEVTIETIVQGLKQRFPCK